MSPPARGKEHPSQGDGALAVRADTLTGTPGARGAGQTRGRRTWGQRTPGSFFWGDRRARGLDTCDRQLRFAIHEAGHAVVACATGLPFDDVWIADGGLVGAGVSRAGGGLSIAGGNRIVGALASMSPPQLTQATDEVLDRFITSYLASGVAEEELLGDNSGGDTGDYALIRNTLRGLSAWVDTKTGRTQAIPWLTGGDGYAQRMEILRHRAVEIVRRHSTAIQAVATELVAHRRMPRDRVAEICRAGG